MPSWNLLGFAIAAALSQVVSSAVVSVSSSAAITTVVEPSSVFSSTGFATPSGTETASPTIISSIPASSPTTVVISTTTTPPTPTSTPTSFLIHPNGNTGKCLDVRGAIFENGTPVQIYDCNGTPAQNWEIHSGEGAVVLAGTQFCLDAGSFPANGVGMKIWQCFSGLAAQDWFYTDDQRIALTNQGFCLDLTNGNLANANQVQTWKCTDNDINQVWTLSPGGSINGTSTVVPSSVPTTVVLPTTLPVTSSAITIVEPSGPTSSVQSIVPTTV